MTGVPVRRNWTVELRPHHEGPYLVCPQCTPATGPIKATAARSAVLAHLARHARREALEPHLRTCQCHELGCRWHPRRRGCAGPIVLALTRDRSGRRWRLADVCTACAQATAHAAVVPDTMLATPPAAPPAAALRAGRARPRQPRGPSEQVRVRETLSYLAAALPEGTSPAARLLALQCALRMDTRARVSLPYGLLRGMRLGHLPALWQELEQARWLNRLPHSLSASAHDATAVQLLDATVFNQAPARPDRARAAGWALQTATPLRVPGLGSADRLMAVFLRTHEHHDSAATADTEPLMRACGLDPEQLRASMLRLAAAEVITTWEYTADGEEVHWRFPTSPTPHPRAVHELP